MEYEPAIDRERLLDAVQAQWRIDVDKIEFVPVGYASACYRLCAGEDPCHFLKVWPDTATGRDGAARQPIVLPLLRELDRLDLRARVPAPVPTGDGALLGWFEGLPCAVFALLPGRTPPSWPDWSAEGWEEIARTLAQIHAATGALASLNLPREQFDVSFEPELRRALERIATLSANARPGLQALREFLGPRRGEVDAQLERIGDLRQRVRRIDGPMVLCHTDFGSDNLLIDDAGSMSVLDWDEAHLAPPEHDLRIGVEPLDGDLLPRFLGTYAASGGAAPLHQDHFAFALLRRYLEDFAARVFRILDEETLPAEDDDLLEGMERWGFDQWSSLDDILEVISDAL